MIGGVIADEIGDNLVALPVGVERMPHVGCGRFEESRRTAVARDDHDVIAVLGLPRERLDKAGSSAEKGLWRKPHRVQNEDQMLPRCEKVMDVNLPWRGDDMVRFERSVGAVSDGVQCHRNAMAHSEEQPFAG